MRITRDPRGAASWTISTQTAEEVVFVEALLNALAEKYPPSHPLGRDEAAEETLRDELERLQAPDTR